MKANKKKDLSMWAKLKSLGPKTIIGILLLGAADCFVIAAPYYLKSLVPNLQVYLNVSEADVSTMTSIIGWVVLLTQLPGGWLADKISSKKLLSIATIMTGVITIWFGTLIIKSRDLDYTNLKIQYFIIFGLWGFATTPLFWTPLWKLVSQQGNKDNQGLVYGLQGSLNGIVGLVFVFGIGTAVSQVIEYNAGNTAITPEALAAQPGLVVPFAIYIYIFAACLLLIGVLVFFFVVEKPTSEKFAVNIKTFARVLQDWKLWALSVFLMGMYMFQSIFAYYLNQMLANVLLMPTVALLVISGFRLYGLRFLVSAWIGKKSDSFRSLTLLLLITLTIGLVIVAIFLFLPGISPSGTLNYFQTLSDGYKLFAMIFMSGLFLISSFLSWVMVTLRYAQMSEVQIPKNSYASANALMSFIGFSSDAWFYQLGSAIASDYTDPNTQVVTQTGYQIIIGIGMIVALIGLIAGFLVYWTNNKQLSKHNINYFRWRALNNA